MADLNTITLIGRVGKEPEFKAFESGALLTKFSLSNNQYNIKTKENEVNWFNIETFSRLGEYVKKGNLIAVNGKLKQSNWTDENGNNKSRIYIFAENIQILTPKEKTDDIYEEEIPI
jgi:single-strand DNA-binding protein